MKKHLSFILLAVFTAFSLAFVSCGGGDDEPSDPTNGNQSSKIELRLTVCRMRYRMSLS